MMQVTKFEKDDGRQLTYNFIDAYLIAINSMPLSVLQFHRLIEMYK